MNIEESIKSVEKVTQLMNKAIGIKGEGDNRYSQISQAEFDAVVSALKDPKFKIAAKEVLKASGQPAYDATNEFFINAIMFTGMATHEIQSLNLKLSPKERENQIIELVRESFGKAAAEQLRRDVNNEFIPESNKSESTSAISPELRRALAQAAGAVPFESSHHYENQALTSGKGQPLSKKASR